MVSLSYIGYGHFEMFKVQVMYLYSILAAMYNAYRQNSNAVKYLPTRAHLKCLTPFGIPPRRRIPK